MIIKKSYSGGVAGLIARLKDIGKPQVLVGVPASTNPRQGATNNATIAATHELGAPSKNIPARPFLVPVVQGNSQKYVGLMAQGFKNALRDQEKIKRVYEKIGLVISNDVKDYIVSGNFVPLKQSTIDAKGSSKPLINTGELRNSITYEVR